MASSCSSLLLHFNLTPPPPTLLVFHKLQTPFHINPISLQLHNPIKFSISATSSNPSSSSSWEREEIRWLREEQRWAREEQRWIREESRWNAERESLIQEIAHLKDKIQALERQSPMQGDLVPEKMSNIANLLQVLKEVDLSSVNQNRISETGSGPIPMTLELEKEEVKEDSTGEETKKVKKKVLPRKGSEGEEVHAMQEALLKLGFYSGEEDMEFSIFSSGTERAIKTWQASLSIHEDGIMTAELLEKLFTEQSRVDGKSIFTFEMENANGASVASVTEVSEIKQIVEKASDDAEVEASHPRVFLLGENRWEDSSRLISREKQVGVNTVGISTTKCIVCRGEGHVLCTECDGTGEPNLEPQFLEWVDEGAKCPYCEGLGYNICDVCEGKTIIIA